MDSPKRQKTDPDRRCTSLQEALRLAETSPCKQVSFNSAALVLRRLKDFRAAAVVYVSRLPPEMWDSEAQVGTGLQLSDTECVVFRDLSQFAGDNMCCRNMNGDFIIPSKLLKIVLPLMKKFPVHKVKELSQISSYIEYMLPRVDVNFRGDQGSPSMEDWEAYCTWMDRLMAKMPLLYAIIG